MSGHSKWHNIAGRKSVQDAKKGAVFSKMAKEITVAVRQGGADEDANVRLRLAIDRARAANVPMDNIQRAIQRGSGQDDSAQYTELTYEGYGPGGVALLVDVLTDNRNRTASDIRYIFSRNGGNLAEAGAVAWMFERKGYLVVDRLQNDLDEEEMLEEALETGADDVKVSDEAYELYTAPEMFDMVRQALSQKGTTFAEQQLAMVAKAEVPVSGKEAEQVLRLIDALEEHDDVQNVFTNAALDVVESEPS